MKLYPPTRALSPILFIETCNNGTHQVCATLAEAKNLENAAEPKTVAGKSSTESPRARGIGNVYKYEENVI
jgi:hypothetical protein